MNWTIDRRIYYESWWGSNDKGYTLVVDLHYPENLHDKHNDYPLCPDKLKPEGSTVEKLCGTFFERVCS